MIIYIDVGTVLNMYMQYARAWSCPLVVFHSFSFNSSAIQYVRNILADHDVTLSLSFELVNLTDYDQHIATRSSSPICGSTDAETAAASRFLMSGAHQRLEAMGYQWFFRVADNSRLLEPVRYDIIQMLRSSGKKYGFISIVRDNPFCVKGLWEATRRLCAHVGPCSDLADIWPEGVVVFTNFEVSHWSVWHSDVFTGLVHERDQLGDAMWGDAAVHTASMISTLRQDEIHRFEDIRYEALMNPTGVQDRPLRGGGRSVEGLRVPSLDEAFHPRRFGWMGGDVASSFALPPESCDSTLATASDGSEVCGYDDPRMSKYIWLFGDSLIGTSSASK